LTDRVIRKIRPFTLAGLAVLIASASIGQPSYTLDYSLAINDISGNVLVLGRPDEDTPVPNPTGVPILDTGAAYVFSRNGNSWSLQQRLAVAGLADNDRFGKSVAISGDTIAVASDERPQGSAVRLGALYVYRLVGGSWTLQARVVPTMPAATRAGFPVFNHVRLAGDWMFVTAADASVDAATPGAGMVFAYRRAGTAWTPSIVVAPDPEAGGFFGSGIDVAGNRMCIGASGIDVDGVVDRGAVYLYEGDATGWRFDRRMTAQGIERESLGRACAIDGENMVGSTRLNRVHAFSRASGQWTHEAVLTPRHPALESDISAVELSGDVAFIGLPSVRSVPPLDELGVVDTFSRAGGQWTFGTTLRGFGGPPTNILSRYFGFRLALDARTLLVSAPCTFEDSRQCINRVYIFDLPVAPPPPTLNASVTGSVATLNWSDASGTATSFEVALGTAAGQSNVATIPMGTATSVSGPIPSGQRFFARVSARNGIASATSREVSFGVDVDPPGTPVLTVVQGNANPVTLRWDAGAGPAPTSFTLIAGTAAGASNLGVFPVGTATSVTAPAPVGIPIFARVRASNGAGAATSGEVTFTVVNTAPAPPNLAAPRVLGTTVELSWNSTASDYQVLARLTPAGPVVARVPIATTSLAVPNVARGSYYVTVVAIANGLVSPESNQVLVVVP
jgi:hypothetical protein